MTLEEAIKHAEEVAEENEKAAVTFSTPQFSHYERADECNACAEEHRQLAKWLTDYQRLLKAIDDIKTEIDAEWHKALHEDVIFAEGLAHADIIIDKHMERMMQNDNER